MGGRDNNGESVAMEESDGEDTRRRNVGSTSSNQFSFSESHVIQLLGKCDVTVVSGRSRVISALADIIRDEELTDENRTIVPVGSDEAIAFRNKALNKVLRAMGFEAVDRDNKYCYQLPKNMVMAEILSRKFLLEHGREKSFEEHAPSSSGSSASTSKTSFKKPQTTSSGSSSGSSQSTPPTSVSPPKKVNLVHPTQHAYAARPEPTLNFDFQEIERLQKQLLSEHGKAIGWLKRSIQILALHKYSGDEKQYNITPEHYEYRRTAFGNLQFQQLLEACGLQPLGKGPDWSFPDGTSVDEMKQVEGRLEATDEFAAEERAFDAAAKNQSSSSSTIVQPPTNNPEADSTNPSSITHHESGTSQATAEVDQVPPSAPPTGQLLRQSLPV